MAGCLVGPQQVGLAGEVCGKHLGVGYVSIVIPDRSQKKQGPDWTSESGQTREAERMALAHEQALIGMAGAATTFNRAAIRNWRWKNTEMKQTEIGLADMLISAQIRIMRWIM